MFWFTKTQNKGAAMKPTRHKFTILKQVVEKIPSYLVSKLAHKYGVDKQSRTFSPWSHVVTLVYAQLAHSFGLNDVSDSLVHHRGALATLRGAMPPSRNGLSHANKVRNADMAEELFWLTLSNIQREHPSFGMGRNYCGFPRRFKRIINVIDSTTIKLVANCMDWAKHRRRKAAAKCHMRLDLQTFLPRFALVKTAGSHDNTEARELCADIRSGEIVVFDKAYVDFYHLNELTERGVFWVSRAKDNMAYTIVKRNKHEGTVLKDHFIRLKVNKSQKAYPSLLRMITAKIEVDGKIVIMTFLSNNMEWSASSICDLYEGRWGVEVFFKQLKQTLQLSDFLGYSENAVRWQVWTALLTYVLLRFISYIGKWKDSFTRLFTVIRGVLWSRLDLSALLCRFCGTADGSSRMHLSVEQLYLPGFELKNCGTA
jgi:IS4 transposase